MGTRYLIDSNILLEYVAGSLPTHAHSFVEAIIDEAFNVSVINRIEVLGHESANEELVSFIDLATVYYLTQEVEKRTIELRKHSKIKLPDAIIAATALVHDFTLLSRNVKDFAGINGLTCLNPHNQ